MNVSLQLMLNSQKDLQRVFDPRAVSEDPRASCEYIKDMSLATMDEIHELLGEVGWKPWATSRHINVESARREWIDAWHFMMNLANKLGMDEEMISRMYYQKAAINLARIRAGYDGVTTKCPGCKRALDDDGTLCYLDEVRSEYWCNDLAVRRWFPVDRAKREVV